MSGESSKLKLVIIFSIAAVAVVHVEANSTAGSSCTTPSDEPGLCVPVTKCEVITALLIMSPRPLPDSVAQLVRRSHCGTFNDVHHICCEQNRTTVEGSSAVAPEMSLRYAAALVASPSMRTGAEISNEDIQSGMAILEASDCGKRDTDQDTSGEQANISEYPWMTILVFYNGTHRTLDCSGSLITDRYVLTVAHCIRVARKRLVSVRLGEHDTTKDIDCTDSDKSKRCAPPIQEVDIEEAIYHEGYKPAQFSNDIGLLRLISKAIFRSNVQPICLPINTRLQARNSGKMIIAGWHLVDNGTCMGDSGGPIFSTAFYHKRIRYIQYGVISGGSSSCGSKFPTIYSGVTPYLPWIAGNLRP